MTNSICSRILLRLLYLEPIPLSLTTGGQTEQCSSNTLMLEGHCHAIWQLYKKLEGAFAELNPNLMIYFCY